MTCEEVFQEIAGHMIEGMMFHQQLSEYYEFLGLPGYAECHNYHFMDESCMYHDLCKYYIVHYNKLLPSDSLKDPQVIPSSWYKYSRADVDVTTKRRAVQTGLEKWVAWERETKALYEQMYKELLDSNDIAAAHEVKQLIKAVTKEVEKSELYHLNKQATDYDMESIIQEQKMKYDEYEVKKRGLFLHC